MVYNCSYPQIHRCITLQNICGYAIVKLCLLRSGVYSIIICFGISYSNLATTHHFLANMLHSTKLYYTFLSTRDIMLREYIY